MSTPYPGYQPFTPSATPSPYGRWLTGSIADDGDVNDSAHLMSLVISATDKIQWLGHRTMDIVSGGTYLFTTAINTRNAWNFTGACQVSGGTASWRFKSVAYVQNSAIFYIGDTGAGGAGHVVVRPGSDIVVDGSGASLAEISAVGTNAQIRVTSNATFTVDDNASGNVVGSMAFGFGSTTSQYTFTRPIRRLGDDAREQLRVKTLPTTGSGVINGSEADIWIVPGGLSAPRACSFAAESFNYKCTVVGGPASSQGNTYQVDGAFRSAIFYNHGSSGNRGSVEIVYRTGVGAEIGPLQSGADTNGGGDTTQVVKYFSP